MSAESESWKFPKTELGDKIVVYRNMEKHRPLPAIVTEVFGETVSASAYHPGGIALRTALHHIDDPRLVEHAHVWLEEPQSGVFEFSAETKRQHALLAKLGRLEIAVADLTEKLETVTAELTERMGMLEGSTEPSEPAKRGPGRPRKTPEPVSA